MNQLLENHKIDTTTFPDDAVASEPQNQPTYQRFDFHGLKLMRAQFKPITMRKTMTTQREATKATNGVGQTIIHAPMTR